MFTVLYQVLNINRSAARVCVSGECRRVVVIHFKAQSQYSPGEADEAENLSPRWNRSSHKWEQDADICTTVN
jgi:hypothetical protein